MVSVRRENGFTQLIILILLILGVGVGVYLVQTQQLFKSRAANILGVSGVTVEPSTVSSNQGYKVRWTGVDSPDPKDFIGLYRTTEADGQKSLVGFYTSSCQPVPGTRPQPSGECPLKVPFNLEPGSYEYRLYKSGDFNSTLYTANLTVQSSASTTPDVAMPTPADNGPVIIGDPEYRVPTSTPIPAPTRASASPGAPGLVGSCATSGDLTLSWEVQSGTVSYHLRIDKAPDSWGGYNIQQGDFVLDNYTGTFDGKPHFRTNVDKNQSYRWWIHNVYSNGSFGPRIEGGIVTCQ